MARKSTVTLTSDLTGTEITYESGNEPAASECGINGVTGRLDLAPEEIAALTGFFQTGDPAALLAILRPLLAPPLTVVKGKGKNGRTATRAANPDSAADMAIVREWLTRNDHDNDKIRAWAPGNGFPDTVPGKAGRLPGAVVTAYATAHGYTAPAGSPALASTTATPEVPAAIEPAHGPEQAANARAAAKATRKTPAVTAA
jgi:Lsr2